MAEVALQWTERVRHLVTRASVPVRAAFFRDGRYWLILGPQFGREGLVAWVAPGHQHPQNSWKIFRHCAIGYQCDGQLADWQLGVLKVYYRVIEHLDFSAPACFDTGSPFLGGELTEAELLRVFPFITAEHSEQDGIRSTEVLLRLTSRCGQRCRFCSAPKLTDPSLAEVTTALQILRKRWRPAIISVTGGEPTLHPDFDRLVISLIRDEAWTGVQIQTNAIHYSRAASELHTPSPRLTFFVSLHGLDERIYDVSTGTHGQMPVAIAGCRRLLEAGHQVIVNCVVTSLNIGHLDDYVALVADIIQSNPRVQLHFSTLIVADHRPEAAELLVPYSRLAPALQSAVDRARSVGLDVHPLRSSTHASLPPCLLPSCERGALSRRAKPAVGETGYENFARPWVKAANCRSCPETETCLGVPRSYGQQIGLAELVPLQK